MGDGGPINAGLNQLISVGFIVGFFGCIGLSIYQAIKGNLEHFYVSIISNFIIMATNPYFHW